MTIIQHVKIRSHEKGLLFKEGEFKAILEPGKHWLVSPLQKIRVEVVSQRAPWLCHKDLDLIVKSGGLGDEAVVLDLKDNERGLIWIDGRFDRIIGPGLAAIWTTFRQVRVETVDARNVRFEHKEINAILKSPDLASFLETYVIDEGFSGILFRDGEFAQTLAPGRYQFWKNMGKIRVQMVDMRETVIDIAGQEIMTADKVTLRLNALVTCRVTDPRRAACTLENFTQAIYREAQLALREVVGTCELDVLLAERERVARELEETIRRRTAEFGISIGALGIRDIILPGEMKEIMNRVIEARKAAEANFIARREETAAIRSQANTAKLLENNPTLMRLRELEVLEKIASSSKLKVVLGEKGLADRLVNLL